MFQTGAPMNPLVVLRYAILVLSAAAMLAGVLIMAGYLIPARALPGDFAIIVGAVIFLYGAYRFAVVYFKNNKSE